MDTPTTASIDWGAIRERLAASEAALHAAFTLDESQAERLMAVRARELAARPTAAHRSGAMRPVLTAGAGGERFIVELTLLAGIVPFRACTPVPGGPRELMGVVNARGQLWAVFDFHRLFCAPGGEGGADGYVLLLRHGRRRIGLRFDTVGAVRQIESSRLKMARDGLTDAPVELIEDGRAVFLPLVRAEALWSHPAVSEAT